MSRDPLIISGGHAIMYGASIILDLRKRSIQDSDPISRDEGIKIGVTIKKNHCVPDRNPYVKTEYFAVFGEGIEQYLPLLDSALSQGILVQNGAFIKDPDADGNPRVVNGDKLQWQGRERWRNYCIDNPEYFEQLKARVRGEIVNLTEEEIEEVKKEQNKIAASAVKPSSKKKATKK